MSTESKKLSQREFDDGFFSEDEMKVIRRMFPSDYVNLASGMTRKDFFLTAYKNLKTVKRNIGPLRTFFLNDLSKRT